MSMSFDKEQVRPYLAAFSEIREAIEARGEFPYNDSFRGRIPEIAGPDEDRAIYLLQCLYRIEAERARIAGYRSEGFSEPPPLEKPKRFARVVIWREGFYVGGTGEIQELEEARIVPDADGRPHAILPKGKRTHGYAVDGATVLVA